MGGKGEVDNEACRHGRDFIIPGRHSTEISDWTPSEECWNQCLPVKMNNARTKFIKLMFILIKARGIGKSGGG